MKKIGVVGAGAWGTALALAFHRKGHTITIWSHSPEEVNLLRGKREHSVRLPGVPLPQDMNFTCDAKDLSSCDIFLLVTPAQTIAQVCKDLSPIFTKGKPVILCSKGIDLKTEKTLSQLISKTLPKSPLFVLSGPSFAVEVAHNKVTAATLAGPILEDALSLSEELSTDHFRLYASDDVKGVEIGGAFKNILAIGAGITEGLGMGRNAHAAFITRGLNEMVCFGKVLGAQSKTFSGLSGIGDLVLSCTSPLSRNYTLGLAIGQAGQYRGSPSSLNLTEGAYTAKAVYNISKEYNLDLPLSRGLYEILYEEKPPKDILSALLSRPINGEFSL
ncbi:MAG: NAD(P)-dependent glycerol-3-phosphate dehydrogenase [bacterium]|nr:NAD(P)-dependent glycerol-3-phosphate dehydrogenase [bacterium]